MLQNAFILRSFWINLHTELHFQTSEKTSFFKNNNEQHGTSKPLGYFTLHMKANPYEPSGFRSHGMGLLLLFVS